MVKHIHALSSIADFRGVIFSPIRLLLLLLAHHDFTLLGQRRERRLTSDILVEIKRVDDMRLGSLSFLEPVFKLLMIGGSEMSSVFFAVPHMT